MKDKIKGIIEERILLVDGAMGTQLQHLGMPAGAIPELWCLHSTNNQQTLLKIHSQYVEAGADVIYACTFGANRVKLPHLSAKDITVLNKKLLNIAHEAARHTGGQTSRSVPQATGKAVLVAGDIGSTGRFVEPFGDLSFEEAVAIFKEQAQGLIEGGADLIVIETMMDIQEARAALLAVREAADDIFTIVTMTYEQNGATLGGTDPVSALITLQSLGADAVGANCSLGPDGIVELIAKMKPYSTVPLAAKPNAGLPKLRGNETFFDMDAATFAAYAEPLRQAGANIIGGCCGTTPAHIAALGKKLQRLAPQPPVCKSISALSSPRESIIIKEKAPLLIIGERLNPTGKKALQEDLLSGRLATVREIAWEQERQGAALLDVNVGVPGLDEVQAMRQLVSLLAASASKPLVIDSGNPQVIEAALRLYPGRVLINSISGEEEKLQALLPLAKKYGAMFIMLPLTDKRVPATAKERVKNIKSIFQRAQAYGLSKDDIIVDGITMSVASDVTAALQTLKTVRWCAERFKVKTVLGISNVSFGMPQRPWLNAALLALARSAGLSLAIANPASEELCNITIASDLLLGLDNNAAAFLEHFGGRKALPTEAAKQARTPAQMVQEAILTGAKESIGGAVQNALAAGAAARTLVDTVMIPSIIEVGARYERREYFLPQLIASAETMKCGMELLEGTLKQERQGKNAATIIIATVAGDVHDIGKNIVALMLKNYGYRVVDLGKDCSAAKIVSAMQKEKPALVGLSALMTTTMLRMPEVIALARQSGLATEFIVGGAVLNSEYAGTIGAHYAHDALAAVKLAQELIKKETNKQ